MLLLYLIKTTRVSKRFSNIILCYNSNDEDDEDDVDDDDDDDRNNVRYI